MIKEKGIIKRWGLFELLITILVSSFLLVVSILIGTKPMSETELAGTLVNPISIYAIPIIVYLAINIVYVLFIIEFHDWGDAPWWFKIVMFPAYIFFWLRRIYYEGW